MSRLSQSVERVTALLSGASLADEPAVADLLTETTARRRLDLSDLGPASGAVHWGNSAPVLLLSRVQRSDQRDDTFDAVTASVGDPSGRLVAQNSLGEPA